MEVAVLVAEALAVQQEVELQVETSAVDPGRQGSLEAASEVVS